MAKKKAPTKAEREHMGKIKQLPCVVCDHPPPSDCHHITQCGRRLGHLHTLPLCYECHRGNNGFSGINRSAWDKSLSNQLHLLEKVKKMLKEQEDNYV
jgi:hypothetical protein